MKIKAENAELGLAQGGRKLVERLEGKVRDVEEELEDEKRHSRDAIKCQDNWKGISKTWNVSAKKRKLTLRD